MKQIHTEIEIDAPADRVWEVLTDFAAFPEWNPFIHSATGELSPGSRLNINLEGMSFKPTLLKAEPGKELRWLGHLFLTSIFDGEHYFIIESLNDTKVRFIQGERFKGLRVPVFTVLGMLKNTGRDFAEMNQALKTRAEAAAAN